MSQEVAEEAEQAVLQNVEEDAEKEATESITQNVVKSSEEDAVKDAEQATIADAEADSEKSAEEDVQKNLEENMEKNISESAAEDVENEAKEAGEQAENEAKDAGKSAEEAAQAGEDAENEVRDKAEQEAKNSAKKIMKRTVLAAAALGVTTLEYLHIKHKHSGCKFPIGCKIPNPKPKAYKGSAKAGGLDKTYLKDCKLGGSISGCQDGVKECKKIKGSIVPGTKVTHGVSKPECDKLHGGYKSCGPLCVAKNTPKTVANQVRRGIHNLIGLTGDMLKYAYYALYVICFCFILSLLMQARSLF